MGELMNVGTLRWKIIAIQFAVILVATFLYSPVAVAGDGSSQFVFIPKFYYVEESYFDIINRKAKEKYRAQTRAKKRHIGFWGKIGEYERGAGIKVVFPF